jgi:hypothetical protein
MFTSFNKKKNNKAANMHATVVINKQNYILDIEHRARDIHEGK